MERDPALVSARPSTYSGGGISINGLGNPVRSTDVGTRLPLTLANLQNDLDALARLLADEIRDGSSLDAYLLAVGMNQIAEDHLHPEIYPLDRAGEYLADQASPVGRIARRAAAGFAAAIRMIVNRRRVTKRLLRWQHELAQLVNALADEVVGGVPHALARESLLASCNAIVRTTTELPLRLRREVVRLPACFHNFDQQPADVARLVRDFSGLWPARSRPLLVVGVRTSGSYLAPLCAAFLRADGYEHVRVLTIRPGRPLLEHEHELVRSTVRDDGLALVTDDPPVTGKGLAKSAHLLEAAGLPPESVVLLLQVFGPGLPVLLSRYPAVVLPWEGWAVNARLTPEAVARELSALVGPRAAVLDVEPVSPPAPWRARRHCRALFRVRLCERPNGPDHEERIAVEGVGLGYLGSSPLAAGRTLERFSPKLFGLRDGLLFREWLPDERRVGGTDPEIELSVARSIASYVSERRHALPSTDDMSLRLRGQEPAWEVASTIVSRVFGRAWPLARVLVVERMVKRLLGVEQPSVVDGGTDLNHWFFRERSDQPLIKVPPAEGSFSNVGLSCFDPVFDLAGATASAVQPSFVRTVRQAYAQLGNRAVDGERLLLYELTHLWRREQRHPEEEAELRRARARALQRYFADVYLGDVEASSSGPLCALDVDGVLETEHQLGFPAMTPASARTLRALMLHGYRPVLASGRSADEIAERCRVYGLAGGVAEYGAAYVSGGGRVHELLPDDAAAGLGRLRSALSKTEGVHVDAGYRLAVRAYRVDGHGSRRGLSSEAIAACLEQAGDGRVRPIPGDGQTDFMIGGVDKATGLRSLASELGLENGPGAKPFELAVGDAEPDIPCAALAALACAPAHAHGGLREAGFDIMRAPYQAGLAEAAARLLGHLPGDCSVCRPPPFTPERKLLLTALAASERGRRSMALAAARLATRIR